MKKTYADAVNDLSQAIDIAIRAFKEHPPKRMPEQEIEHCIKTYASWKDRVINPSPQYKNLSSLKYHVIDVFAYFQESAGQTVDFFWEEIKRSALPFIRENKLKKILKRKKIKDDPEYDFVVDVLVPYQMEGLINKEDVVLVNEMIAAYEQRKR